LNSSLAESFKTTEQPNIEAGSARAEVDPCIASVLTITLTAKTSDRTLFRRGFTGRHFHHRGIRPSICSR
jgi:hypothetical protein